MYQTHHQTICFMCFFFLYEDILFYYSIEKNWKVGQCDLVLAQWILSPLSFTLHHLRAGLLLEYTSSEQVMYLQPLIKRAYVFTLSKDMQFFSICNVTEMYFWKKDKENYPKNNHYLEEIWSDKLFTALVSPTMSPFAILCSHKHRTAEDYSWLHLPTLPLEWGNEANSDRFSQDKYRQFKNRQTKISVQVDIPALNLHSCS